MNRDWVLKYNSDGTLSYKKGGKEIVFSMKEGEVFSEEYKQYFSYISPVGKHFHSKESKDWFDVEEGNCNTCLHLQRTKHNKCKAGFLNGVCVLKEKVISFHPNDPLHNECYEHRSFK